MTIIQKINFFFKKNKVSLNNLDVKFLNIKKFNPLFLVSFLIVFTCIFFISSNLINKKNNQDLKNFKEVQIPTNFQILQIFCYLR